MCMGGGTVVRTRTSARRAMGILAVGVVVLLSILPTGLTFAQGEETRYFEETKHNVSGEFLEFFDGYGGRKIFGYPLTREFEEDGRVVQCFQRVRMEKYPDLPRGHQVRLALLGEELGYRLPSIPESEIPRDTHPDKRYFAETGHTVSFAFLDFFRENGGLDVFGYPITEWDIEPSGRISQYFQRAKMEWYPENPPGQRVQLGALGIIYVETFVDPIYKAPEPPYIRKVTPTLSGGTPATRVIPSTGIASLKTMVTVKHPIIGLDDTQTAYVYVFDQSNRGVPGASVEIEVQYEGKQAQRLTLGSTNADGHTQIDFSMGKPSPAFVVIVNVNARYGVLTSQASTGFFPWW